MLTLTEVVVVVVLFVFLFSSVVLLFPDVVLSDFVVVVVTVLGSNLKFVILNPSVSSFSISYTVSNPEKYKNKLLENAINNSKEKAIVLANASGVKLGNILSIDYSWSELRISSSPFENKKWFFEEDNDESDYVIDVEIDDIDVTDTVTVIWNIE